MNTNSVEAVPPVKADSTNQKIIDAAEKLFAEKGYEGTTLREIAKAVGIREPSIYSHFSNKEAIYGAVIDRALLPFFTEINDWNRQDMSFNDMMLIPRKMLTLHSKHPFSAQILHREFNLAQDRINPKVMGWLSLIAEQSHQFMGGIFGEGEAMAKSKTVANIVATTNITLGVFSSVGVQTALMGGEYEESELFEEHVKIVTRIFKILLL